MDKLWIHDINILLNKNRIMEFWPNKHLEPVENMNALCRFSIYSGILLSILKQDMFYIIISLIIMAFLTFLFSLRKSEQMKVPKQPAHQDYELNNISIKKCRKPTKNNPFSNINYLENNTNQGPACPYNEVKEEINKAFFDGFEQNPYDIYNKKHSQRQFFSVANTTLPNNQESFAQFLYGNSNTNKCKENTNFCTGSEAFGSGGGGGVSH